MKTILIGLAAMAFTASTAQAAPVATIDSSLTNWNRVVQLDKFDASLGTLTGVTFNYSSALTANFRAESLDAAPGTLTLTGGALVLLGLPISKSLTLSNTGSRSVTAYDGAIDFRGTSGFSNGQVTASASDSFSTSLASVLSSLTGAAGDTFDLQVTALAQSTVTGVGNLISQVGTLVSASVSVAYQYVPVPTTQVPEPHGLALVGLAMAGLAVRRRHH